MHTTTLLELGSVKVSHSLGNNICESVRIAGSFRAGPVGMGTLDPLGLSYSKQQVGQDREGTLKTC